MKTVYAFMSHREYLQEFYEFHKRHQRGFTLAAFAKKADLKSGAYLKMILEGKRKLTVKNIHGFAKAAQLNYEETQYFEALVHYEQAEDPNTREFYGQRIKDLSWQRPKQLAKNIGKNIFSDWYYPAALVCIENVTRKTALKRLEQRLGLGHEASSKLIAEFLEVGLILSEKDKYVLNAEYFVYQDATGMKAMHKNYIQMQLKKSQEAFERHYDKGAQFFAHTFTLEKAKLKYFTDKIDVFLQEITDFSNQQRNETVAQLNVQLYEVKPD